MKHTPLLLPALLSFGAPAFSQADTSAPTDAGSSILEGVEIFRSDDGKTSIRLDARVTLDATVFDEGDVELDGNPDLTLSSGTEVRQARLGFKGVVDEVWSFELDMGFADAELDLNDVWIGISPTPDTRYRVGQFKEPFSLQSVTSSRYSVLMERPLMDVFSPGRSLGIASNTGGDNWSLAGGLFGEEADSVNDGNDFENADNEGFGFVARGTYAPILESGRVVHIGASARRGTPDAETDKSDDTSDVVRYRTGAENHMNHLNFLDTGRILGVDWIDNYGFETAVAVDAFRFEAEYVATHLDRSGTPGTSFEDADFSGYYGQVSYMLTGESAPYRPREGEFGRIVPESNGGAWELAYRYSGLDLDDSGAGITGGESVQQTIGINWYGSDRVRVGLNYAWIDNGENADANGDSDGDEDFSFVQLRCQISL